MKITRTTNQFGILLRVTPSPYRFEECIICVHLPFYTLSFNVNI